MSAIKHALINLEESIGRLDNSLHGLEQSLTGEQRDMFSASSAANGNDAAGVVSRLDNAIEKVEELLGKG